MVSNAKNMTPVGSMKKVADEPAKPKKEKKAKPVYPAVAALPKDGKLDAVPGPDFRFDYYAPVKRTTFKSDELYLRHKANELRWRASGLDKKADEAKLLGSTADRAKAKRLQKMQAKMADLRAELEKQGIDVDALLKK